MTGVTQAEVHVLTDIDATAEYMRQLWAEALTVYKTGHWSFVLEPELEHRLDVYRMSFMAEDTSTGVIQQWLDQYVGDYVCTKMLYREAYRQFGEPDRKTIGEINDIMNNTVEGWKLGPQHRFTEYGPQRSWVRIKDGRPDTDKWVELTGTSEQTGIPPKWLEPP